jgi:hypothetical protein
MSRMLWFSATALLSGTAMLASAIPWKLSAQGTDNAPVLKQIASIDLPGPPGKRFDYLVIDYDDGSYFPHVADRISG